MVKQLLFIMIHLFALTNNEQNEPMLALDRLSTCADPYKTVYESDLIITARSNVAPFNPQTDCTVYLESAYQVSDGRYRLQIVIEQLVIEDCNVRLSIFNGHGVNGYYLRELGCSSKSTDIIYTRGRLATIRFRRPLHLRSGQTAYSILMTIRTYEDGDEISTHVNVIKFPIGAIIGIVVGCLAVVGLAILLLWCCFTGYIHHFVDGKGSNSISRMTGRAAMSVEFNKHNDVEQMSTTSSDFQLRNGIGYFDQGAPSNPSGISFNVSGYRNFQPNKPRRAYGPNIGYGDLENRNPTARVPLSDVTSDHMFAQRISQPFTGRSAVSNRPDAVTVRSSSLYRKKDDVGMVMRAGHDERCAVIREDVMNPEQNQIQHQLAESGSTEVSINTEMIDTCLDNENGVRDGEISKLSRFESLPDVDTIASPMHVNAATFSSIPDLTVRQQSSSSSSNIKTCSDMTTNPDNDKSHYQSDLMMLPPEAQHPVFSSPMSKEKYLSNQKFPQSVGMAQLPFISSGLSTGIPCQNMYAFAYQYPGGGYPYQQGAYFMQSVPTPEGDVQNTAFAMQTSRIVRHANGQARESTGLVCPDDSPQFKPFDHELIARGMTPADLDQGHRSITMKTFSDPDSGIQTARAIWREKFVDPSDPKPGDSTQVARQTTTQVMTRSGHCDLPTVLEGSDVKLPFSSPSGSTQQGIGHNATSLIHNISNMAYYLGQGTELTRPTNIVHDAPYRHRAIKDQIAFGDSTL